ncbi:MAG: hypothetical protein ACP5IZ_09885 [Thermoprotei archaeon]|jgi:hypothetical protein
MKGRIVISCIIILFLFFLFSTFTQNYIILENPIRQSESSSASCLQDVSRVGDKINETEGAIIIILRTLNKVYQEKFFNEDSVIQMVNRLNESFVLLNKAKQELSEGNIMNASIYVCLALNLTQEANHEVALLYQSSMQSALQQKIIVWGLVPIASFVTTLSAIGGYKWYTRHEKRKILKTIIFRKKEE